MHKFKYLDQSVRMFLLEQDEKCSTAAFEGESKSLLCLTINLSTCLLNQINRVVNLIQTHHLKIKPEHADDYGKQHNHLSPKALLLPMDSLGFYLADFP